MRPAEHTKMSITSAVRPCSSGRTPCDCLGEDSEDGKAVQHYLSEVFHRLTHVALVLTPVRRLV